VKRLFDGTCRRCFARAPRCANVHLRVKNKAAGFNAQTTVLCEGCRKRLKGQFRYAAA
jgi:hypothetical protein